MLGGSQAGARLSYRVNADAARPLSLSARLYSPIKDRKAAEAAVGVEWQPLAEVPVRLLAERRQALGRKGRSAFSILAHGGVSALKVVGPVELSAYAQAGIVGLKSRDLFADGSVRLDVPIDDAGTLAIGAGAWGAVQPSASRLDAGPSLSVRLPLQGRNIRISADWRLKVAGDASPGSGPALTIGSDF
jgi:hypothetical protein